MGAPDAVASAVGDLRVHDLGIVPYDRAFALQKQLQLEVIESRASAKAMIGHLLLLEHDPPVITISRRPGARRHLVATEQQLRAAGIQVAETDRGGDITYHGPGQLVVYPILDLNRLGLRIHSYMRVLEQIVIDVLAQFRIPGVRDESATGVWVPAPEMSVARPARSEGADAPTAKICAMGVRVSKWVSMHGLALNVTTNLAHFDCIVPCGLAGRRVTSMHEQLGDACPSMNEVKRAMLVQFRAATRGPRQQHPHG